MDFFHSRLAPALGLAFVLALGIPASSYAGGWSFSRARVLEGYRQGDFEQVVRQLSPILLAGNPVSQVDSVFAYRLLGVVYAADPKTREMGRHCWMNLLDMDPKANLVDLFVGEELDRLWERTRLEHQARRAMIKRAVSDSAWMTQEDAAALQRLLEMENAETPVVLVTPVAAKAIHQPSEPKTSSVVSGEVAVPFGNSSDKDSRPYWKRPGTWIAATMAASVVGFTVYYTFGDEPTPPQKFYHVANETAAAH